MVVVHCKKNDYDVYIGRPGGWGNPFTIGVDGSREEVIVKDKLWLWKEIKGKRISLESLAELDGKILGCWCSPKACHGDVLQAAACWAASKLK